jgi:transcriptional regulator with XRE-family HTH domain
MESGQRPNRRLRLQRRLHGWSQEDVVAGLHRLAASLGEPELGVDATMVSRWERGTRRPRPRYVRLLCRLFELPAEQLGVVEDDDDVEPTLEQTQDALEDDDVERRHFIHRLAALLGAAAVPMAPFDPMGPEPWERLARALHRPGQVDAATVDHLEGVTISLQRLGPMRVSSREVLGPVTGHLDAISLLLQGSLPPSLRARLCSLAAETAGFAGWLRWNMDDPAGAARYFVTGLDAAREGGDRALAAYLAGSAACQPPYRETPQRRLAQLQSLTWSDATPSTRAWLAAKEADAHALLGDAGGCLRALERADRALDGARHEGESRRPRFSAIDRTWLEGERGASLARLGRTGEARQILRPVLDRLGAESERDRLWLGTALASTYVQDGEPEEACRVATAVLERAAEMRLDPVLKVVEGLYEQLGAFGPRPAVGDLGERLRTPTGGRTAGG